MHKLTYPHMPSTNCRDLKKMKDTFEKNRTTNIFIKSNKEALGTKINGKVHDKYLHVQASAGTTCCIVVRNIRITYLLLVNNAFMFFKPEL